MPEDIFWGPAFANEWLNTIWGVGGAALDFDRRHCAFFRGERLAEDGVRPFALSMMRALWAHAGWTIECVE